jgi:hypothetical protein
MTDALMLDDLPDARRRVLPDAPWKALAGAAGAAVAPEDEVEDAVGDEVEDADNDMGHGAAQDSAAPLAPDGLAAAAFLAQWVRGWRPEWLLNITAIWPDDKAERTPLGKAPGRSWPAGDLQRQQADIAAWIARHNALGYGVYFTPNPLRRAVNKKPLKEDIAASWVLSVDLDPPEDTLPYEERRDAVLAAAAALPQDAEAPVLIVDSGHGIGAFYRVPDGTPIAEAEAACDAHTRGLAARFGLSGGGTKNCDRLMRLPGTLNWPSPTKRKKGYPDTPAVARVLSEKPGAVLSRVRITELAQAQAAMTEQKAGAVNAAAALSGGALDSGDDEAGAIAKAIAELKAEWPTIRSIGSLNDLPPALRERVDTAILYRRRFTLRWHGQTDDLTDTSGSGLLEALLGCCKAAGFSLLDAARIVHAWKHNHHIEGLASDDQRMRALARGWVRSKAVPDAEGERREHVAQAGKAAAKAALASAFPGNQALVDELLPLCVVDDAATDAEFTRKKAALAAQTGGMSGRELAVVRKRVLHAVAAAKARAAWTHEAGGREVIEIRGDHAANMLAAEQVLGAQDPPAMFVLGSQPVAMMETPGPAATQRADKIIIRGVLARAALYISGKQSAPPPMAVAEELAARGSRVFPPLRGLAPHPVLLPDGGLALAHGYDRASGMFLTADWSGLSVPAAPTQADAAAALGVLLDPFADFPFDPPEGRAAMVAHILHMLARHLLPVVPGVIYVAPAAGTGKTLAAEAASHIVHGRAPTVLAAVAGRGADEEMRKRITSMLLTSQTDFVLDNIGPDNALGGQALDALLTAPEWSDRLMGGNAMGRLPNTAVMAVTGNNLRVAGDTGRRMLFVHLDAKVARPEKRGGFRVPDLRAHLRDDRARLLAAALTVLRGHVLANDPLGRGCAAAPVLGSFEVWSRLVAAALEWAGCANPIATQAWGRARFDAADEDADSLDLMLCALHGVFGSKRFTVAEALAAAGETADLTPTGAGCSSVSPTPQEAAAAALAAALDTALPGGGDKGRRLGKMLAAGANRTTGGGWAAVPAGGRAGVRGYTVEKRNARAAAPAPPPA